MQEGENERNAYNAEHHERFRMPKVLAAIGQEIVVVYQEKQAAG